MTASQPTPVVTDGQSGPVQLRGDYLRYHLLNAISSAGTFLLKRALALLAIAYLRRKVSETEGVSLEQIEREMT
jgi:hypothetical protein